jgi:hypothetical protein
MSEAPVIERAKIIRAREERSKMMRERWADPEYRAQQTARHSARMKREWADPQLSEKRRAKLVDMNRSKKARQRSSAVMKALNADPAFRAKLSTTMAKTMSRPELRDRARQHAKALAVKINARRRRRGNVVPEGKEKLYKKLRVAGIARDEALRVCRMAP